MGPAQRELCPNLLQQAAIPVIGPDPAPWLAIIVKPQFERAVQKGLEQKGLETYLPLYWATHRWSDRTKRLQLPLFPLYVFCRAEGRNHRTAILSTPGVRSIVSFGSQVVPVPESELDRIRLLLSFGCDVEPWPFLRVGERVRVECGALAGLEGILADVRHTARVVVSLDLLQRSVAVQLPRDYIRPVS